MLSSPLSRALDTARLAGFEPEVRDDLAEWDYGEYDGLTTPEIREQVPDWTIWRYGAVGGESVDQLAARADRVVEELLGVEGDVLVFSHGHFLRVLTARWLGLAAADGPAVRARLRDAQHARLRARAARDPELERAGLGLRVSVQGRPDAGTAISLTMPRSRPVEETSHMRSSRQIPSGRALGTVLGG